MPTPLYGPAADRLLADLDPETAAFCPPRPADYYDDYDTLPPLTHPHPVLPPKPENATPEELRKWEDHCWMLENFLGSGN